MNVQTTDPRENLIRLLTRETPLARAALVTPVDLLLALGWTPHEARRGILTVCRTGLSLQGLLVAATLAPSIAEALDAFSGCQS